MNCRTKKKSGLLDNAFWNKLARHQHELSGKTFDREQQQKSDVQLKDDDSPPFVAATLGKRRTWRDCRLGLGGGGEFELQFHCKHSDYRRGAQLPQVYQQLGREMQQASNYEMSGLMEDYDAGNRQMQMPQQRLGWN
ncbi:MAG: hypothetical protein QM706_05770 [Nitrospira sp.]